MPSLAEQDRNTISTTGHRPRRSSSVYLINSMYECAESLKLPPCKFVDLDFKGTGMLVTSVFFISDCLFLILSRNMATRSRANITSNLCQSNYRSLEFIVNFVFHSEIISGLGSRSNMTWHKHNNFEDPKILSPHKKYHKIKIIAEKKGFHQSAI